MVHGSADGCQLLRRCDEMTQPLPGRKLIRTPIHNIPIGEAVRTADGRLSLRIKKPNGERSRRDAGRGIRGLGDKGRSRYGKADAPDSLRIRRESLHTLKIAPTRADPTYRGQPIRVFHREICGLSCRLFSFWEKNMKYHQNWQTAVGRYP